MLQVRSPLPGYPVLRLPVSAAAALHLPDHDPVPGPLGLQNQDHPRQPQAQGRHDNDVL